MNCEQRSLSVTEDKYLFYYKVNLYSNYLYFNDFSLISIFEHLIVAVELMSQYPYGRKYLSLKTARCIFFLWKTLAFSQPLNANKYSCQPLAARKNLDSVANCKPNT